VTDIYIYIYIVLALNIIFELCKGIVLDSERLYIENTSIFTVPNEINKKKFKVE